MENSTVSNFISGHPLRHITFGWIDYALFGILLGVSALIGVYFGFFGKKQDNTTEYLMGGKTMSFFPIAMSLVASHISGVSLLSVPAEIYLYGTQYAACVCTVLMANILVSWIYLPVFYRLQLASTFEYLEIRFARPVRQFASFLCTLTAVIRTPLVIYVPALAFSQATAINLHYITPVICIVCIFYTTLGGLKAVVWADTIQIIITIGSLVAIVVLGTVAVGGISEVWRIAEEGGRIILLDLDPSPFARNSFWGMSLGLMMTWMSELGTSQLSMQRFLAVPTMWEARKAMICMAIAVVAIKWTSVFTGLAMFAKYHECDPLASKLVMKKDQILPYYVLDVAENVPGLPGLFLAGLVSASLSTMSAALNTVAGTIYEDFIEPWLPKNEKKEHNAANIMKFTVVILGLVCLTLVFLMDRMGDVFSLSISLASVGAGTMLGIFSLGMLIPWANTKGAVAGGIASLFFMIFIICGAQLNEVNQSADNKPLDTSTKGCVNVVNVVGGSIVFNQTNPEVFNSTVSNRQPWLDAIIEEEEPLGIFMISFMYYTLVGAFTVIVVGIVVSLICGPNELKNVNRDHFANFVRRHIPHKEYKEVPLHPVPVPLNLNLQNLKNKDYKSYA